MLTLPQEMMNMILPFVTLFSERVWGLCPNPVDGDTPGSGQTDSQRRLDRDGIER